ncbi:18337_t:CDS:2, partial [Acaulospora morrowiae]
ARPPPSLPLPEINRNDIAFERLIELNDSKIPVKYGKSNFDVVISVGKEPNVKKFRSHSVVLSMRSSYFRAALSSTWAKKQGDVFYFDKPNITPKVFTVILRYLYFGNFVLERLDVQTLLDVLVASDELMLEDFIEEIQYYFINLDSNLLIPNLIPIITTCFNNPSFGKLLNHLLNLIRRDPSCLVTQVDIFLLQESMLSSILEKSYELLDDSMMWSCIIKWGIGQQNMTLKDIEKWTNFDYERLHETIHSFLKFVRFSHIPRNYFIDQIVPFLTYFKEIDNETIRYYLDIPQPLTIDSKHNSFDVGLTDSTLVNHTHMSRIADWIDTGKINRPIQRQKLKKCTYRFSFPFFRKRNQDINLLLKSTAPPPPPKKPNYTFNLLYRMTRDGSSAYHDKCLKQGPTLVIVKIRLPSGGSILIGGYNPLGFDYFLNIDLSSLSQTFIFSFGDGKSFEGAQMSRVQTDWSRMTIKFSNGDL